MECLIGSIHINREDWYETIRINNKAISEKIDTRNKYNIVPFHLVNKLKLKIKLLNIHKLFSYLNVTAAGESTACYTNKGTKILINFVIIL